MASIVQPERWLVSAAVYRVLLFVYPAAHRREYGSLMVQAFQDLCRETAERGVFALAGLWIHTLLDLVSSACREHVSAWKGRWIEMSDVSHEPVPWRQIGLAVLPGVCAAVVTSGLFTRLFDSGIAWLPRLVCLAVVCVALLAFGSRRRRVAIWCLPALGILSYALIFPFEVTLRLLIELKTQSILAVALGVLMLLVLAGFVFQRRHIARWGWMGLCLAGLLSVGLCIFFWHQARSMLTTSWLALWPAMYLAESLFYVVVGIPMARRYGVRTSAFVMTGLYMIMSLRLYTPWSDVPSNDWLTAVCYLIVPTIWVFRARSTFGQVSGLLASWLVMMIVVIADNFPDGIVGRSVGQILILSALAMSILLYYQAHRKQNTQDIDSSALPTAVTS